MKIVSVNYLDPNSDKPWLIRDASESLEAAAAFRKVLARGRVTLSLSSEHDNRFGYPLVVSCEEAFGAKNAPFPQKLSPGKELVRFDGCDFLTKDGVVITECQELLLQANGLIYAVL